MLHFGAKGAFRARFVESWVSTGAVSIINEKDPSEEVLRAEIEKLAGAYPRYGYRRIAYTPLPDACSVDERLISSSVRVKQQNRFRGTGPWSNL